MRRVNSYIDGFNLYHAIDSLRRPHLKWLDLSALTNSLLRADEMLGKVKYFSAYATWMPDRAKRHRDYVHALREVGVEAHMAQFKQKPRECRTCQARWTAHEEKETDVQIAVHMLADALCGEVDRIILISADTDLRPPIQMVAKLAPNVEVFVAAPPKRMAYCRALSPKLELTPGRLERSLLPASLTTRTGQIITRPPSYDPPGV